MERKERKYINSRPLFYCFLALLVSIIATRFIFNLNIQYLVMMGMIIAVLLFYFCFTKHFMMLLCMLAVMLFGVCWFFVGVATFNSDDYVGEQVVQARVTEDISYYDYSTRVLLDDVSINGKTEKNMYLTIYDTDVVFNVGDIIVFSSEIEKNQLFSLGNFNSGYYRDNAAYSTTVNFENIAIIGNDIKLDESFRLKVKDTLYKAMGEENGATAYAVLFGSKTELDSDIYDAYQTAGIVHLLTVSGLHVGFLITLLGFILKLCKVNRVTNFIVCFLVLMVYAYLCGFAPSIVRAGVMGLVHLGAKLSGKCYDNLNTFGLAGLIILLCSPLSALDNGFLMSFFCVLGIFVLYPGLSKIFKKVFSKFAADSFAISIATQVAILPFLASFYSELNFLTFFVNLIVIPIFSVLYPVLFLSAIICLIFHFMSFLLMLCGYGFSGIYYIADFFSQTSLKVNLEPFNVAIFMVVCLIVFVVSNFFMGSWKVKTTLVSGFLGLITVLSLVFVYVPMSGASVLYSFKYQNDLVAITTSQNQTLVVDGYDYDFIKNGLNSVNGKNLVGRLSLNTVLSTAENERLGLTTNFYHEKLNATEGYTLAEYNKVYSVAGFKFKYLAIDDRAVGLQVTFDGKDIFIIYDSVTFTDAVASFVADQNFDMLLLGNKSSNLEYFNDELVVTYGYSGADYSYMENGSLNFLLDEDNFIYRSLD